MLLTRICKLVIDQDHHDESFVHLMPELRCHKTELISNCTKNNVTVLHCVSDAFVIQLQCNVLRCDIIERFELVLFLFSPECIVTLLWMCFGLFGSSHRCFECIVCCSIRQFCFLMFRKGPASVFSILKGTSSKWPVQAAYFVLWLWFSYGMCYFNLTKADLFCFKNRTSFWHFWLCLEKLGANFVVRLLLDFFLK